MKDVILPKNVKIANHEFKIINWNGREANAHSRHGDCAPDILTMRISTGFDLSQIKETLLHEILHGIYWAYNIYDEDKEERIVTTMAVGLSQVLSDNLKVSEFLTSKTKREE